MSLTEFSHLFPLYFMFFFIQDREDYFLSEEVE